MKIISGEAGQKPVSLQQPGPAGADPAPDRGAVPGGSGGNGGQYHGGQRRRGCGVRACPWWTTSWCF